MSLQRMLFLYRTDVNFSLLIVNFRAADIRLRRPAALCWHPKGLRMNGLSPCKRPCFTLQKAVFQAAKDGLLQGVSQPADCQDVTRGAATGGIARCKQPPSAHTVLCRAGRGDACR